METGGPSRQREEDGAPDGEVGVRVLGGIAEEDSCSSSTVADCQRHCGVDESCEAQRVDKKGGEMYVGDDPFVGPTGVGRDCDKIILRHQLSTHQQLVAAIILKRSQSSLEVRESDYERINIPS